MCYSMCMENVNKVENVKKMQEDIKDGKRFSLNVEKLAKKPSKRVEKYRKMVQRGAIEAGIIDPHEENTGEESDEMRAKRLVAESIDYDRPVHLDMLTDDDVEFINELPEDGAREIVIKELFGSTALKAVKAREKREKSVQPRKSRNAEKFIRLYKRNYDNMLAGKKHQSLKVLMDEAGYGETVQPYHILRLPWIAKQLEDYHKAVEYINDYHYRQIDDRQARIKARATELKDRVLKQHIDDPTKLSNTGIRDQANFLKILNELTSDDKNSGGPTVAIQLNADSANVAMRQNKEKSDHFEASFE